MTTLNLEPALRVMSAKQIRSIVGVEDTPQIALWAGAVSSGKTIASLLAFFIQVAAAPDHGLIVIVGRTLQTIERNIIEPLESSHLFGWLGTLIKHTPGSTTAVILGRTVHLIGANDVRAEGRIRGSTIALAYVDEATLIPQSFWMMLLSRLRVRGARLLATTNPDGPGHWLRKDFILKAGEVGARHWHFTLDDNPSLTRDYVDRLKAQYVGLWHRRFIKGEWCLAQGAVYDMWDSDRHVVEKIPPIVRWVAAGADYGTVNPFHAGLLGLGQDGRLYLTHEWRYDSKRELRSLTDAEYSVRFRGWLNGVDIGGGTRGVQPDYVVIDPSAASFRVQLKDHGLNSVLGKNEVVPGIRTVASLLATDLLKISADCPEIINEFPGYSWDDKKAEKGDDEPVKAEDHGLDMIRYIVHTTQSTWRNHLRERVLVAA
ncbi:PBSX family phage terminase large subunit [Herbidospora mongoliensis]|uniref:PBSX family phage terminase large subunit n=1 Tax=Herbidospora mongoliensis TaxID=688067 RepID=UPI00082F6E1F|nr:PBSX family phage terminase large subunit [Herbidospora mongoliensis]